MVPLGTYGIVHGVKVSAKRNRNRASELPPPRRRDTRRKWKREVQKKTEELREQLTEALSNICWVEKSRWTWSFRDR